MSPEQADKSFRIPHKPVTDDPPGMRFLKGYFKFQYTTGNIAFDRGGLHFDHGRLNLISMELKDATQCDDLLEALRGIYGDPAADEQNEHARTVIWHDNNNNNKITLQHYAQYAKTCWLNYEPLKPLKPFPPFKLTPAPGGL